MHMRHGYSTRIRFAAFMTRHFCRNVNTTRPAVSLLRIPEREGVTNNVPEPDGAATHDSNQHAFAMRPPPRCLPATQLRPPTVIRPPVSVLEPPWLGG